MTVRVSTDDGQTWPTSKVIHPGPAAYCCLVALPDGTIGLLYECGDKQANERIDFARFKLE
jgi:sialidase-1